MLHTNIKAIDLVFSDKKIFSCLTYISLHVCKTCDPRAGPFLVPGTLFEQSWWKSTRRWTCNLLRLRRGKHVKQVPHDLNVFDTFTKQINVTIFDLQTSVHV